MARGDQLARQWQIIQMMLSSRMGKSATDLARELECTPRTIYRDLEALQEAGFPIYTERIKSKHLWSLLDTVRHQIPLPVTFTELAALYFGFNLLNVFKDTFFYDSLKSLFQKIKNTLPPESITYLENVEQTLQFGFKPYKEYGKFKEIIRQVNEAAINKKSIEIVYYTMSRKSESRRKVDPYRIWFFNGTFYLIGHCHFRGDIRIFALDRIKLLHQTQNSFEIPDDFDLKEFLKPSFGVFQGKAVNVKIRFSPDAAGYIKEKIWLEGQIIHEQADGSLVFEAEVAGTEEIKFWVMNWGSKAEVLEPESLKDEIREEAEAMLKIYKAGVKEKAKIYSA
ncbi:MAG: transcriptional regulator [Desulfobacterales bacterium]|nr:transcriptional regulator [Desulfobacterales bacterium]